MPSQSLLDEIAKEEQRTSPERETAEPQVVMGIPRHGSMVTISSVNNNPQKETFTQRIGLRRRSVLAPPPSPPTFVDPDSDPSYFKLYRGNGDSKVKADNRLSRLKELYRYAKILFDYVGPQEYGISDGEKLEIGLLTSLPLLREIVQDLEELQASDDAKSFIYFTKESHIYTLLNCILEGGIKTKITRATIPELDYLSQIKFELYEARDSDTGEYTYSIVIKISPGCYTLDPLDVSLDSKHAIKSAPLRSLTYHQDWKEVIESLKAKFETVQLPKSFLAVNVSDKHDGTPDDDQPKMEGGEKD
jgi:inositol hexakisphosphate/diphosphoinositol-pentakisphosphate kinase